MIRIRPLRDEDYERLVSLWSAAGLSHRPKGRDRREAIAAEIEGASSVFLVAEIDGEMVGAVLGTHDGRKGWINRLAVHPEHRRKRIGLSLVEAVEERLHELGIQIVTCLIETWNQDSVKFFTRIGYVEHGECKYYSKRRSPDT